MKFSKYQGLGNDFAIVDLRDPAPDSGADRVEQPGMVRALCDRHFGVGADGVLAILPSTRGAAARMRTLNADGSEAEMCGNGLRCVVKYLFERDPTMRSDALTIDTPAGLLSCAVTAVGAAGDTVESVTVDMGRPHLERSAIPMTGPADERCVNVPLQVAGTELAITAVSMGNPHAIAFVEPTAAALLALAKTAGPVIECLDWFPNRTNVEFARVHNPRDIELVVWERGCGITLACGTGACATAVAACLTGRAEVGTEIGVRLLGGVLTITVAEDYRTVWMRGPATHVFDAEIDLDKLPTR